MHESLVPIGPPKQRRKSPRRHHRANASASATPTPSANNDLSLIDDKKDRIPMLVRGRGVHQVIPKEATRDVLSGKVAYYLVDDKDGVTLFEPKHLFTALKLDKDHVKKFEDYSCIGAHQRTFAESARTIRNKKRNGLGYRRKYVSEELLRNGIYVSYLK